MFQVGQTFIIGNEDKDKGIMEIYEVFMLGRYGMEQCIMMEFYSSEKGMGNTTE